MDKILKDLPSVLTFTKKWTQQFPNNQKVTLYYNDALKKYISIIFSSSGYSISESSSEIDKYSLIEELQKMNEEEIKEFFFQNGLTININKEISKHILDLYEKVDEKEKFEQFISESDQNFLKMLEYSVKIKG